MPHVWLSAQEHSGIVEQRGKRRLFEIGFRSRHIFDISKFCLNFIFRITNVPEHTASLIDETMLHEETRGFRQAQDAEEEEKL